MRLAGFLIFVIAFAAPSAFAADAPKEMVYTLKIKQSEMDVIWRLAQAAGQRCDMSTAGLQFCRDTEEAAAMFKDFSEQVSAQAMESRK